MDLELLKYISAEGGVAALSVLANFALVYYIRRLHGRVDTLTDKLFTTIKDCAEAMTEARISSVAQAAEMVRSISMLGKIIEKIQSKGV